MLTLAAVSYAFWLLLQCCYFFLFRLFLQLRVSLLLFLLLEAPNAGAERCRRRSIVVQFEWHFQLQKVAAGWQLLGESATSEEQEALEDLNFFSL
jgi:hypothetical protein